MAKKGEYKKKCVQGNNPSTQEESETSSEEEEGCSK